MIARDDITSLKIITGNWFVDQSIIGGSGGSYAELGTGHTQVRTASVEYPAGTWTQIKWSGASSITEADGSTNISDAVSVTIPNGATFYINMYVVNASGCTLLIPDSSNPLTNLALGDKTKLNSGSDKTLASFTDDGGGFGADGGYGSGPIAVVAMTSKCSVLLVGTSLTEGLKDTVDSSGDIGYARSIGPSFGYCNAGIGGDSIAKLISGHTKRAALSQYFSHTLLEGPTNDDIGTPATAEANYQTAAGYWGNKVIGLTCTPKTTSTDNWATTANQTIVTNFATINTWLNTIPYPLISTFDITTAVSAAGKWNVNGVAFKYTPDGIHANQFANLAIKSAGVIPAAGFTR